MPGFPRTLAGLIVTLSTAAALAHDFWIEPSTFHPRPNEVLKVGLRVGDHFVGEGMARSAQRIVRFACFDSAGERPILGRDGAEPAGLTRLPAPGVAILAFRSNDAFVELEGPKFEAYLVEKGLDAITAMRQDAGETAAKTREAYSRAVKALICVRDDSSAAARTSESGSPPADQLAADRPIGLTLEIVAETNPYAAKPGDELTFRVLHEGKPLPEALVTAARKTSAEKPQSARTDGAGRVRFRLSDPGVWLIATVHMTPAAKGVDAKWQSIWASETFELEDMRGAAPSAASAATQPAAAAK